MMHQHEHGVSKCLGCEHFVSGLSEYEGACCHQHRFISVDQNSAMHNCSLGEGLSIGCLEEYGHSRSKYRHLPNSTGFLGLNLAEEIDLFKWNWRKLVQPSPFPSILRLARTFRAEDPTTKEHTCHRRK